MAAIPEEYFAKLATLLKQTPALLGEWIFADMARELPSISPQKFFPDLFAALEGLSRARESKTAGAPFNVGQESMGLLKALVLKARLMEGMSVEQEKARASNARALAQIETRLTMWDRILRDPAFKEVPPLRLPHLLDVISLERYEELTRAKLKWETRLYDEKFHCHLVSQLFHPDLSFFRHKCLARDVPIVVAFVDIDNLRNMNAAAGELHVDRHALLPFATTLEATVYGHGQVYRFSGDEYALLFPSSDEELATALLNRARAKISALKFKGVDQRITLSVGFCTATPDCHLTNEELLRRCELAMNYAKLNGRNCMATYSGSYYDETDLTLMM